VSARAAARPLARLAAAVVLGAAAALPAGCAAQHPPPFDPAARTLPRTMPTQPMRSGFVTSPPGVAVTAQAVVDAVRADAAQQLSLADGSALSVAVEEVTWSDGSLGCPQPGRVYTQALVPGWLLVVRDGTGTWRYHASRSGFWVQCPGANARPPLPGAPVR
jgi:hypothetical protein